MACMVGTIIRRGCWFWVRMPRASIIPASTTRRHRWMPMGATPSISRATVIRARMTALVPRRITESLPRGIVPRLRIVAHIAVGVHPLRIALLDISRHKAAHHQIIVARVVVVKPAAIAILAREAFVCRDCPSPVAGRAVGAVDLHVDDCSTTGLSSVLLRKLRNPRSTLPRLYVP